MTKSTPSPPSKQTVFRSFWFVIYPNEDANHKKMLDYLLAKERFQVFYIEHNRCFYTANSKAVKDGKAKVGDPIKPHTHVFVKFKRPTERMSPTAFGKWFAGWINVNEPKGATSADACAEYFMHENPASLVEGKTKYAFNEIKGDEDFISKLIIGQNAHFVQWQALLPMIKNGSTIVDLMESTFVLDDINESRRQFEFILSNQYLLLGMTNQQINEKYRSGGKK